MYRKVFKRLFDFIFSLFLLILLSPVLAFSILILTVSNKGKPFFTQKRPGLNGKIFPVYKLKTMTDAKDSQGNLLPDEARMTFLGAFLRKSSMDEWPQLINVLKGDMSVIGPRPLLMEYLLYYTKEQTKRHLAKPGITGLAQINGGNRISWQKRFEYDVFYAENFDLSLDFKILKKTFRKILFFDGFDTGDIFPPEKFNGVNL